MSHNEVELLFVEDNVEDAMLSIRALDKIGLTNKLLHVRDGAEALDFVFCRGNYSSRIITDQPRLVLLDLKMPKISGVQVLKRIKSDQRTKLIPVVILTSSSQDPDIETCYRYGANSYIVKPVEGEKFYETLKGLGLYWMVMNQIT